jgi:hypothetical protein
MISTIRLGCSLVTVLVLVLALSTGCVFDDSSMDAIPDSGLDVPGDPQQDLSDGDQIQSTCNAQPDCDSVYMGCTSTVAGMCFPCCGWGGDGFVATSICCPGADVLGDTVTDLRGEDVPSDAGDLTASDIEDVDAESDCGQMLCIDCVCTCDDGRHLPYGGCFDDCNPVPDVLNGCSADCVSMCGTEPPRNCQMEGIPGDCDAGQACVTQPCPHCGARPQSFCVKAPCQPDGCYVDADCRDGGSCYDANIPSGVMGFCEIPDDDPISCWSDSACPGISRCDGLVTCPPCAICDAPNAAGTCRLQDGNQETVLLHVQYSMVTPGETITATWYNFTSDDIFLSGCSTFSIDLKDSVSGQWVDQGPPFACAIEGIAVHLPAGQAHRTMSFTAPMDGMAGGPATYRLRGQYFTGCIVGQPLSSAKCTNGPFEIDSIEYLVGQAP